MDSGPPLDEQQHKLKNLRQVLGGTEDAVHLDVNFLMLSHREPVPLAEACY